MNGDSIAETTTLVNGETEAEKMTASCGKQQLSDDNKEGKQDTETDEHLANSLSNGKAAINSVDAKEMATKPDISGDEEEAMEVDSDGEKENSDTNNAKGAGDSDDAEDVMCVDDEDGKSETKESKSEQTECGSGSNKSNASSETAQVTDSKKDDENSDCEVIDSDCGSEKTPISQRKTSQSPDTSRNSTPLPEKRTPVGNLNNEVSPSVTPSAGGSTVSTPTGSRSSTPSQAGTGNSQATTPIPSGNETPKQEANKSPTPGPSTSGVSPTPATSVSGAPPKTVSPGSAQTVSPKTEPASAQSPSKEKPSKLDRMLPASYKEPDLRPMADLLVGIGQSLVYQQVYRDLVRVQRKKKHQKRLSPTEEKQLVGLEKLYDNSVEVNQPYHLDEAQCQRCGFHTETETVLEMHKEFAHMGPGDVYLCSFCNNTTKNINTYFEHMLIAHKRKGRIHMKMSQHVCPLCPYDNSSKTVFSKHLVKCQRTFSIQRNLEPRPADSDIPLKKMKYVPPPQPKHAKATARPAILKPYRETNRPRGPPPNIRPSGKTVSSLLGDMRVRVPYAATKPPPPPRMTPADAKPRPVPPGMTFGPTNSTQPQYVQLGGSFYCLMMHNGRQMLVPVINPNAPVQSMSAFSPRGQPAGPRPLQPATLAVPPPRAPLPGRPRKTPATTTPPQTADPGFQVCEICGGFVKDRESLRVHFFWAHRTDIPKDNFYSRKPGINCKHCIERFWTRPGLARHMRTKHQVPPPAPNATPPKPKTYTCIVCNQKDIGGILEHLQSVHGISLAMQVSMKTCMVCGKALSTEEETKQHLNQQHPGINQATPPAAAAAAAKTTPTSTPDRSKRREGTVASLMAKVPTRSTPQGGALADALTKDVTPNQKGSSARPFCPLCHIQFASVSQYLAHRNTKHSFVCPRCPNKRQYSTLAQMEQHYRTAHKGEQDPCPLCDAELNWGKDFIAHMTQKHLKKCAVAVERLSTKQLQKHKQQMNKGEEVIVLEDARLPDSQLNGKRNSRKRKLREEIIEVDGEQVIVQQQDSDSD